MHKIMDEFSNQIIDIGDVLRVRWHPHPRPERHHHLSPLGLLHLLSIPLLHLDPVRYRCLGDPPVCPRNLQFTCWLIHVEYSESAVDLKGHATITLLRPS